MNDWRRREASALQLQEALAHKAVDDIQKALEAAESDGVDAATLSTARERVTRAAREERAKASQETGQTAVTVEAEEEDRRKKEGAARTAYSSLLSSLRFLEEAGEFPAGDRLSGQAAEPVLLRWCLRQEMARCPCPEVAAARRRRHWYGVC